MATMFYIQNLFLQSAQGGGGGLLIIIVLIIIGVVFYIEKRKTRKGVSNVHANNQNKNSQDIVSFIRRNKLYMAFGAIIAICLVCVPLEISRVNELQEDSYQEGYAKGEKDGYKKGYDEGYSQGESDGSRSGQRAGYSRGYNDAQIRTTTCMSCSGRGVKICFHCSGTGCGMCGGTGVEKCNMCDGRGWNQY